MNNLLISGTLITTILSSCSLFNNEPNVDQMTKAIAKWQKVEAATITEFSKKTCEAGRISYLYSCTFEMSIAQNGVTKKSSTNKANFVSHDSGENWLAYP